MKPLIIIPARGGSKGIPNKNIKLLNGEPLIKYTIDAAKEVFDDDQICVSTDSIEIKNTVEKLGLKIPFIRPKELATDEATTYNVLLHAVQFYKEKGYRPDVIILLQATSPFRTSEHIKNALKLYNSSYDMVVSVKETQSNPYYVLYEEDSEGWLNKSKTGNFTRRQDCPKVWEYNGAIYLINPNALEKSPLHEFKKIKKFVMDDKASLDIDTPFDWTIAEALIASKK